MPAKRRAFPTNLGPAFSVKSALLAGHTRAGAAHPDLVRPFRGARVLPEHGPPQDPDPFTNAHSPAVLTRMRALNAVMSPHAFFEGTTAALLHGLPVPQESSELLYVATLLNQTVPHRGETVATRKLSPRFVSTTEREGVRTLDASTAWASCGKRLSLEDLVVMADALRKELPPPPGSYWAPEPPLCTLDELASVLARGRWASIKVLRTALSLSTDRSASPAETRFRLAMHDAGLPEPELNADIVEDGIFFARPDYVFRQYKVCVEYQSTYHLESAQYEKDRRRMDDLRRIDWIPVEITRHSAGAQSWRGIKEVRHALMNRGWEPM